MNTLLKLAALATAASAQVGLLVPYYEYPTGAAAEADWNALIAAIDAHPQLPFYVIINNNNGAPYATNPPDEIKDWATWLDQLNAANRTNVKTIGYVATTASTRDASTVAEGVDQYASWTTSAGWTTNPSQYNVRIDGVFFDEIDTDPAKLAYNTNITTYAKSQFPNGTVVLNPGVVVNAGSESLFDVADAILQIETCYTSDHEATDPGYSVLRCPAGSYVPFTPSSLDSLGTDAAQVAKSSVVVHDFYDSWNPYVAAPEATLETDVGTIVQKGVHSFYVSQYGYHGNFTSGPASITNVALLAAAAQGLTRRC